MRNKIYSPFSIFNLFLKTLQ